jgi:D-aminopeptidase
MTCSSNSKFRITGGILFFLFLLISFDGTAQRNPRARDLGIPFDGSTGPWNAITDVVGVEVGHVTLISGDGKLVVGKGPVRTGVTVILPRGKKNIGTVFAGWWTLNGNGEMTGTTWVEESGGLGGPIALTNTHSVGVVRDAVIEWLVNKVPSAGYSGDLSLPVVAETWDGFLNDINGFHVKKEHVFRALESAQSGVVGEGNVGGGTGMICHQFKAGIGTSSRVLPPSAGGYMVGVLIQANYGSRDQLRIAGVPVGKEIKDLMPKRGDTDMGSIIVVVATDAPLLPHQLKRLAKRASLGLGRMGSYAGNSSGDIFVTFSTANADASNDSLAHVTALANEKLNPLFLATVQATEESIVNALVAAETMTGINGNTVHALPHDRLKQILKNYSRLIER